MFVKLIDLCHFFLTFSDFTTLRCLHSSIRLVSVWYPSGGKVVSPLSDLSGQEMRRGMWPGTTGMTGTTWFQSSVDASMREGISTCCANEQWGEFFDLYEERWDAYVLSTASFWQVWLSGSRCLSACSRSTSILLLLILLYILNSIEWYIQQPNKSRSPEHLIMPCVAKDVFAAKPQRRFFCFVDLLRFAHLSIEICDMDRTYISHRRSYFGPKNLRKTTRVLRQTMSFLGKKKELSTVCPRFEYDLSTDFLKAHRISEGHSNKGVCHRAK